MPVINNTYSLQQLFHERVFTIPDYQRGYAWETSHVQDFLEDLDYMDPSRHHYTGTVVLHARAGLETVMDEAGTQLTPVDVVDGQQRLTTIVILLDCVRRALVSQGGDDHPLARGIERNYVRTVRANGQPVFRITLNSDVNDYFRSNVLGNAPTPLGPRIASERRLVVAKDHIDEHLAMRLSELEDDAKVPWLQELYSKVVNGLRFSLYQVEEAADVGIIFEVMNDRGKPLTELEKVKNYLLYASTVLDIPNQLGVQVNEAWSSILRRLMESDLEESDHEDALLRAHWIVEQNPQARGWKRIDSVKGRFDVRHAGIDPADLLADLESYTRGLEQTSIPFGDAYSPRNSKAFATFAEQPDTKSEVREWSEKLGRLRAEAIFVPLLSAVRLVHPNDASKYLETLKLCENYAFRVFRLQESRTDAGQQKFFWVAHQLRNGEFEFHDAMRELRSELARRCDDVAFNRAVELHVERRRWYEWRGLRYFLYEYEVSLAAERRASPRVTWADVLKRDLKQSIEHVLPQNIENVPEWKHHFDAETHRHYRHDLGNLTLTQYNASLSNKPFHEKKGNILNPPSYAASPLFQELELTQHEDWTPEVIDERREQLLQWARDRWAVDLDEVDEVEVNEDELDDYDDEM